VKKSQDNEIDFQSLLNQLAEIMTAGSDEKVLHWRKKELALVMLTAVLRVEPKLKMPATVVRVIFNNLIDDHLSVRNRCLYLTICALKQQKRKHLTVEIDPLEMKVKSDAPREKQKLFDSGNENPYQVSILGDRPDNRWLQYQPDKWPNTSEKFADSFFVSRIYCGWYCWPGKLEVYAPTNHQPILNRIPDQFTEQEQLIYEFFTNSKTLDQLMSFFTLEQAGAKFSNNRYFIFKYLAANYGSCILPKLKPYLERYASDAAESKNRLATEMIAGLVRGSKHWVFEEWQDLRQYLVPLIKQGMAAVSPETAADWRLSVSSMLGRHDPNLNYWLLEPLANNPLGSQDSAFNEAHRVNVLAGAVIQHGWRIGHLNLRLVDYFLPYISHPYQTVRESVSSIMATLLRMDVPMKNYNNLENPSRKLVMDSLLNSLRPLLNCQDSDLSSEENRNSDNLLLLESSKKMLDCVSKLVTQCVLGSSYPEFHALLPMVS
jgi:proteasome activator subunit 4